MPDMADQYQDTAGSIDPVEPAYVLIGRLQKSHGVRGEITLRVFSDFPERIRRGKTVCIGSDFQPNKITGTRWKNDLLLLKLEGFDNPESVQELVGKEVFSAVKDLPPLSEGKFYHHQLIGLHVWEGDEYLGVLAAIMETGANEVYIIDQADGSELLLPAIPEVILKIDLEQKRMDVHLLEGLRD